MAAAAATAAHAGAIVGPTGAVIDAGGPGSGSISNTYDQSGLSASYVSGVTNFDSYIGSGPTHTEIFAGYEWFSNSGTSSAAVTYDLGSVMTIDALALWNEESSGIGTLKLFAPGYGLFATVFPTDNNLASSTYLADVFKFGPITTRYVTFEMSGCPQPNPGSYSACAIGEVAFRTANGVPEPATWALMIGGFVLAGAALRRRRAIAA